jgi:hypothetical protein
MSGISPAARYGSLLALVLAMSGNVKGQMFEELKKEKTVAAAQIIIGAYAGYGISMYTYDPNKPPATFMNYTPAPHRELRACAVVPVHLNLLFRTGRHLYLGGGLDYQLFSAASGVQGGALRFSVTKPVVRMEIQPRPGKNVSVALMIQAGPGIVSDAPGGEYSLAMGTTAGSLFSIHLGKAVSLTLGMLMGFDTFKSVLNNQPSRHNSFMFGGNGGLRVGI